MDFLKILLKQLRNVGYRNSLSQGSTQLGVHSGVGVCVWGGDLGQTLYMKTHAHCNPIHAFVGVSPVDLNGTFE